MADFTTPPDWSVTGTAPSDTLKEQGFTAGYKPPAAIFNWFWTKVSTCLKELQEIVSDQINNPELTATNVINTPTITDPYDPLLKVSGTSDLSSIMEEYGPYQNKFYINKFVIVPIYIGDTTDFNVTLGGYAELKNTSGQWEIHTWQSDEHVRYYCPTSSVGYIWG